MKFELEPNHRNKTDEDLLNDLVRVAQSLGKDSITIGEYKLHGIYHPTTLIRRFGSWFKVLEKANLRKTRNLGLSDQELLDDLARVSKLLGKNAVTRIEYNSHGKFGVSTFSKRFGSWFKALELAGLQRTRTYGVSEQEYFKNIEEVWIKLGRQPHYAEMRKPLSKYSAGAYDAKFGSWRKALERFVEYINSDDLLDEAKVVLEKSPDPSSENTTVPSPHRTKRMISDRLRFIVMKRDNFKCKICGRSPATDQQVMLHVDHILPWSKGGETLLENLQTLCSNCNLGKGDLI